MNKQEILNALNAGETLSNGMFAVNLQDAFYYNDFDDTMEVIFRNPEDWEILSE